MKLVYFFAKSLAFPSRKNQSTSLNATFFYTCHETFLDTASYEISSSHSESESESSVGDSKLELE